MDTKIITSDIISATVQAAEDLTKQLNNDGHIPTAYIHYVYPKLDGNVNPDAYAEVMTLRQTLHSLQQACGIVIRQLTYVLDN